MDRAGLREVEVGERGRGPLHRARTCRPRSSVIGRGEWARGVQGDGDDRVGARGAGHLAPVRHPPGDDVLQQRRRLRRAGGRGEECCEATRAVAASHILMQLTLRHQWSIVNQFANANNEDRELLQPTRVRRLLRWQVRAAGRRAVPQARPRQDGVADRRLPRARGGRGRDRARDRRRGRRDPARAAQARRRQRRQPRALARLRRRGARLLREAGIDPARVDRRLHDIAEDPSGVEPADVVVLHRVVCCYPDYERLLGAAAERARRLLVFSHPPRNLAPARSSACRTSPSGWAARSSARSRTRRRRWSASAARTASPRRTRTPGPSGRSRASAASGASRPPARAARASAP